MQSHVLEFSFHPSSIPRKQKSLQIVGGSVEHLAGASNSVRHLFLRSTGIRDMCKSNRLPGGFRHFNVPVGSRDVQQMKPISEGWQLVVAAGTWIEPEDQQQHPECNRLHQPKWIFPFFNIQERFTFVLFLTWQLVWVSSKMVAITTQPDHVSFFQTRICRLRYLCS